MALDPGTRFGPYEVTEQIGVGGMGEVYRATDTKLGRDVAIKTLPSGLAADADRLARFEREAQLLAALNHAHIASIYGLDEHEGTQYLAMELVEGITLEEKLKSGPLPIDEALRLTLQIALALEAAHDKGVVHRDLKPANVMVNADGQIKVLDFGLAKAFSNDPIDSSVAAHSPALSVAMTQAGLVLGTAGYMSPEQASGQVTDQRADVWSFGVVLYEMLTGLPLFTGESVPHILADVLRMEPDWDRLPKNLHPRLKLMLERCLKKKARDRYHAIADARIDIEEVLSDPDGATREQVATQMAPPPSLIRRVGVSAGLIAVAAAVAGGAVWFTTLPEPEPVNRFVHGVPEGVGFRRYNNNPIAISPDGRRFAYNTFDGVYLREMGELEGRLISGTEEDLRGPFFAPDGESIAYHTGDLSLKRIAINGGASIMISEGLGNPFFGASWESDGTIFFAASSLSDGEAGIFRVSANGGEPELVIAAQDGELLGTPQRLPAGDAVVFAARAGGDDFNTADIVAQSLTTGERTVLVQGGSHPRYLATGHLIYAFEDTLRGVAFDAGTLTVSGGAVSLVQGIARPVNQSAHSAYAVSHDGTLIYVPGGAFGSGGGGGLLSAWMSRDGGAAPIDVLGRQLRTAQLSPDGTRVAFGIGGEDDNIWIYDFARGTLQRLTFDEGENTFPVWVDDERIVFARQSDGEGEIYVQAADGSGVATFVTPATGGLIMPSDITTDGGTIFYSVGNPFQEDADIFTVALEGEAQEGEPLIATDATELNAVLSPDGRWVAYQSNESGPFEIYLRPYPDVESRRIQVSTAGGTHPLWSQDGSELYYMDVGLGGAAGEAAQTLVGGGTLMAVSVDAESERVADAPAPLFDGIFLAANPSRQVYDVAADGRFVMIMAPGQAGADDESGRREIVIVENWIEDVKQAIPTN